MYNRALLWISTENMIHIVNILHFVKTPGGPSHKKDINVVNAELVAEYWLTVLATH